MTFEQNALINMQIFQIEYHIYSRISQTYAMPCIIYNRALFFPAASHTGRNLLSSRVPQWSGGVSRASGTDRQTGLVQNIKVELKLYCGK